MANEGGNRGLSDLISTASHLLKSSQKQQNASDTANEGGNRGLSDLISTASHLMNSSQHSNAASSVAQGNPTSQSTRPSQSEILASAQFVMNAAKAKMQKPSSDSSASASAEEFDMGKLAAAASTLVGAASSYGNLDEGNYGKYAQKAQEYLHSYETKHGKTGTTTSDALPQADDAISQSHGNNDQVYSSHASAAPGQNTYGQGHSSHTSASGPNYGPQSSTGYPPSEYPDDEPPSQGYGHQGHHQQHTSATGESYGHGPQPSTGSSPAPPSHGYGHQGHQQPYAPAAPGPNYGTPAEYPDAPQSHEYGYQGHQQPYTSAPGPNYGTSAEYPDAPQSHGYGYQRHHQPYTSASGPNYRPQQPSAGYPPSEYSEASQYYGYPNASNEAPMGYPPPDYPASGGSYMNRRE